MIQDNDIICFCNDWDGDPLSKKQIVSRLAKKNRVLWVNSTGNRNPTASVRDVRRAFKKLWEFCRGCRTVEDNISLFCPLVIPFHGSRLARWLNQRFLEWSLRRACRKLGFEKPITLTFVPSSAGVAGRLGERLVVYYCVDEYSQFTGTDRTAILQLEENLMRQADLVIVSAGRLYDTKCQYNPNTFLITHGVDVEHFRKACLPETVIPPDCAAIPAPVIGFFGLIEDWVDLKLIARLAAARPEWSFLLIGDVRTDASPVAGLQNVHLIGRRPYKSLPAYCKKFDVAILPFVVNELTLAANPLKLREYLAAGLPVVATALPEVERLGGLLRTARTPHEFLSQLEAALVCDERGPSMEASQRMDAESWDEKVEVLSELISRVDIQKTQVVASSAEVQIA
jgi:glycosyltransferase involved in cell wall biosynthesis